jgi:hypothetical protein
MTETTQSDIQEMLLAAAGVVAISVFAVKCIPRAAAAKNFCSARLVFAFTAMASWSSVSLLKFSRFRAELPLQSIGDAREAKARIDELISPLTGAFILLAVMCTLHTILWLIERRQTS